MENIPKDRHICKWCWYCECGEDATGEAICSLDIREFVNVNDECCDEFEYDPDFVRY